MSYDIKKLRDLDYLYVHDQGAQIPCPDCHGKDRGYCLLCDGEGVMRKSRALAVLPTIVENVDRLRERIKELEKEVTLAEPIWDSRNQDWD